MEKEFAALEKCVKFEQILNENTILVILKLNDPATVELYVSFFQFFMEKFKSKSDVAFFL